jgi:methylmalonyl-CoA/ethylmalonyl-CoA epimerase
MASKTALPPIDHIGQVVFDLDNAMAQYAEAFGLELLGEPRVVTPDTAKVRGIATPFSFRIAFMDLGGTKLELIEPLDDLPSPYNLFLREHGEGLHHLAFYVPSIDDQLEPLHSGAHERALECDALLGNGRARYVYTDGMTSGAIIELIQTS